MEHCYSRDLRRKSMNNTKEKEKSINNMTLTRTILVHKTPLCPHCVGCGNSDEGIDMDDSNITPIPAYDEENAKHAMDETMRLVKNAKNLNSEEEDFEMNVKKIGWNHIQLRLFSKIIKILDTDRLARLANTEKSHEAIQRRILIDKSAERFRKVLATVQWDTLTVQWLHGVLMECLPPSYLSAYLDIMQCLKHKLPPLVDKMIFWKPGLCNQELLAPILKKPWQPIISNKNRKLPGQSLIVVVPSAPRMSNISGRQQKILHLLATMTAVLPIQVNIVPPAYQKQHLQAVAEQMISVTRTKIQELKSENPERQLILVGFNSALALQIALVEQVAGVICFGFAYNTVHGPRGNADDHLLDLETPVMFLIGQNSARSSQDEIELLRERMTASTVLTVVGSADDCLRLSKTKMKIEGITQEMVDNMIMDEISDFASACLVNPPPPKTKSKTVIINDPQQNNQEIKSPGQGRKRKLSQGSEVETVKVKQVVKMPPKSIKNPLNPASLKSPPTSDVLDIAVQSILPENEEKHSNVYDITTNSVKPKPLTITTPSGTFKAIGQVGDKKFINQQLNQKLKYVQLKAGQQNPGQKFYTLKPSQKPVVQLAASGSRPSTPPTSFGTGKFINIKNTAIANQSQENTNFSPTKFTILKTPTSTTPSTPNTTVDSESPDLSNTSIMDIPIVFADNDGNIEEETIYTESDSSFVATSPPVVYKSPAVTGVVKKNIVLNKNVNSKLVVINKGSIISKPGSSMNIQLPKGNIIQQPIKYLNSKIVVSNRPSGDQQKSQIISFPASSIRSSSMSSPNKSGITISDDKKIEILNNTLIKPAGSSIPTNFQSVRINADGSIANSSTSSDRVQTTRSIIKIGDGKPITVSRAAASFTTTTGAKPTIVIRSNSLKPYPSGTKITNPSVLNRQNLTVKTISSPIVMKADQQQVKKIIFKKD